MWPFSHKVSRSEEIPEPLRERVSALESDFKRLRAEWNDIYDRIVHQFDRERKRRSKLAADSLPDPNGSGTGDGVNSPAIDWSDPVEILKQARMRGL